MMYLPYFGKERLIAIKPSWLMVTTEVETWQHMLRGA